MVYRMALWCLCVLSLVGCDKTAEVACENASCPPGTTIDLQAESSNACEGSASGTYDANILGASAEGEISGQCFSDGSCVYACYVSTECCGAEQWTETSYSCDNPCSAACGNGECEAGEDPTDCPQDCASNCGNDECEYGEVCIDVSCADLSEDSDCAICKQDCCPVCGNGLCEYSEDGAFDNEGCPEDCSGDACAPSCTPPHCGADDGCGGTCEEICPGGFYCGNGGTCVKGNDACAGNCAADEACVDDECVAGACVPDCPAMPACGGGDGCGNQCLCPDDRDCLNGQCQAAGDCEPQCALSQCGGDDGCGGTCDAPCPEGFTCTEDMCAQEGACEPVCNAGHCSGNDGCGGMCEFECPGDMTCVDSECKNAAPEEGTSCTNSSTCDAGERCDDGVCTPCPAECDEVPCSQEGCHACGKCPGGKLCTDQSTCVGG